MNPKFTVVIMAHESASFVAESIESVLSQSNQSFELIVSDDASQDETFLVAKGLATDNAVRLVRHEKNLGQARHWAWALQQGTAPFVGVLHADDAYLQTALEHFATTLDRQESDLAYGNFFRVEPEREEQLAFEPQNWQLRGHDAFMRLAHQHLCLPSATFVRRSAAARAGDPDPNFAMLSDREFALRLAWTSRKVSQIAEPVTRYRVHENSLSSKTFWDGRMDQELSQLAVKLSKRLNAADSDAPTLRKGLRIVEKQAAQSLARHALLYYMMGNKPKSRLVLRQALKLCPRILLSPKTFIDVVCILAGDPFGMLPKLHHRLQSSIVSSPRT